MNSADIKLKDKNLRDGLELLEEIASSTALSRTDRKQVDEFITEMHDKLDNVKLKLGIIGEFNSGKSTLLNNLLGQKLAVVGDRPCTPVPIYIDYAKKTSMIVNFENGKSKTVPISEYEKFTDYEKAPKGIKSINISINSNFLQKFTITLIDTPGINAIDESHTKITESVIPEMNASILLIYSKQPGSKSTIEFLKNVSKYISKIFVCVSKSDFLNEGQLNRISSELPKRLSKASNLEIDKVWTISFTEKGLTSDTQEFFEKLKLYMESEYYNDLTKDLYKIMKEYSAKINELLENRIMLQEEVFFDYLKSKPTDYKKIAADINNEAKKIVNAAFNLDDLNEFTDKLLATFTKGVDQGVRNHLNADHLHLGIIKQRVTKDSIKSTSKFLENYTNEISDGFIKYLNSGIELVFDGVLSTSKKYLSKLNKTLADFDNKILEEFKKDEEIKKQAIEARQGRFMVYIGPALIATIISFFFLDYSNFIFPIIAATLNLGILVYLLATANHYYLRSIEVFAWVKKNEIETFTIPEFTIDTLSNLSFNSLDSKNYEFKNEFAMQFGAARAGVTAFGPAGALLGLGVSAISYLSKPTASETHQKIMDELKKQIKKFKIDANKQYNQIRSSLDEAVEAYVNSIPINYNKVLNRAFKLNTNLIDRVNKKITLLKKYNEQLSAFEKKFSSIEKVA
ncbi:MAG: dynamin family protein [Ignavibacteria bacterium]|nr:dynamin family protein [Ignavibacteria bacterium]